MRKILLILLLTLPTWAVLPASFLQADREYPLNDLDKKLSSITDFHTDPTKWAIIISPEKYNETDDVIYSVKSGKTFATLAKKVLNVSERKTYLLTGEDATMGKIKNSLNKLIEFAKKGDTIYFYYSGHGIPDIDTKEPYILPKDLDPAYVTSEPQFKLANIYKQLQESKATKVVAFVDSCFSGATDNKTLFTGVAAPRIQAKTLKVDATKMVVLVAGRDKQFSNMYAQKHMRMFSYHLMSSIADGKDNIKDIYKETKKNVEDSSFSLGDQYFQSPTIEGNLEMAF